MRGRKAPVIELSVRQHAALTRLVRQPTTEHRVGARARIILAAAQGGQNQEIAQRLGIDPDTVCKWRGRWARAQEQLAGAEAGESALSQALVERLLDAPRSGRPGVFTPEQIVQILAIACEDPQAKDASDRPISHWTPREIASEAVKRKVVSRISARTVGRFLKSGRS